MTPEAAVKAKIRKVLDSIGCWYCFPPANGYGRAGIPDVLICYKGKFLAIEAKAGKGRTTALQDRELKRISEAGGTAWVVREADLDTLKECIEGFV